MRNTETFRLPCVLNPADCGGILIPALSGLAAARSASALPARMGRGALSPPDRTNRSAGSLQRTDTP
jgi:hypothetical protein